MSIPGWDVRGTAPYGLAILRIVLGIAMVPHGWAKLQNIGGTAEFFGSIGIPAPAFFAWVVMLVELVGGLLLIVGFLTQIVGILIFIDMLGAILFAFLLQGRTFINPEGGAIFWEKEAVFAAAALCLALAGPGAWSVDDVVGEPRVRTA